MRGPRAQPSASAWRRILVRPTSVHLSGRTIVYTLSQLRFEWDPTREDSDVVDEERFATLGLSSLGSLLVVVYTYRGPDIIRVISAWKANRRQKGVYEKSRS